MWKHARRSPGIVSRSSTGPPPRIMWKTSATTVARASPVPDAIAQALATSLMPSTKPRNSIEGMTPSRLPISSSSANRSSGTVQVHHFPGRAGDDVRAAQLDGLRHPSPAVVEDPCVLGALRRDPAVQRDHADDLQAGVGEGPLQLGHAAALLEVGGDLVVPGLDRRIAGLAGDRDLLQQGRRPDRAGVEAVDEFAHGRSSAGPVRGRSSGPSGFESVRALRCAARKVAGCDRVDRPSRRRRRSAGRHRGTGSRR